MRSSSAAACCVLAAGLPPNDFNSESNAELPGLLFLQASG